MWAVSKDTIYINFPLFHSNSHKKTVLWEICSKRKSRTPENVDKQQLKLALPPLSVLYSSFWLHDHIQNFSLFWLTQEQPFRFSLPFVANVQFLGLSSLKIIQTLP